MVTRGYEVVTRGEGGVSAGVWGCVGVREYEGYKGVLMRCFCAGVHITC